MEYSQPKTVVVNGHEYTIQKFMADDGLKIAVRVVKMVAEPVAGAISLKDMAMEDVRFGEVLKDVVGSLVLRLDEEDVMKLVADLLSVVIPEGQTYPLHDIKNPTRGNWKVFFQGRPSDMIMVAAESAKENFQDFLSAWKLIQAKLPKSLPKATSKHPGRKT